MRQQGFSRAATTSLLLLVALAIRGRAAGNAPYARLTPERVAGDPAHENSRTPQFLQADAKGRVFLLHGDNLEVDQILPSGKVVVQRASHDGEAAAAAAQPVIEAVVSPDGSSWLLLSPPDHLSILHGDDHHELPAAGWLVSALAYTGDGPMIAVLPVSAVGAASGSHVKQGVPPFILQLHDQTWQTLATQKPVTPKDKRNERPPEVVMSLVDLKGERDTRLAPDRKDAVWVAKQNAYLLTHYSSLGVEEDSVAVGGGTVQWKERSEEEWQALEKRAQRAGAQQVGMQLNRTMLGKARAVPVIRGFTSQDRRVYLVVDAPEGLALDRWDGETLVRLRLAALEPGPGRIALAAGHDGLYIGERGLGEPIWRVSWQQLEDARWEPVPDAVLRPPAR
ncbi:MAG TPA: hypothetical protein VOA80_14125 [Thermoanaerobaculia bacterium]|nr:hypothetical protein [Thermoanaerobaculia bacterium]